MISYISHLYEELLSDFGRTQILLLFPYLISEYGVYMLLLWIILSDLYG